MATTELAQVMTIRSNWLRVSRSLAVALANLVLAVAVLVTAMPFVYMMLGTIKPQYEIYSYPIQFLPTQLYLTNYEKLFGETMYFRWYFNTVVVAVCRTLLSRRSD